MANYIAKRCPRCLGPLPSCLAPALSWTDNRTRICGACARVEGQLALTSSREYASLADLPRDEYLTAFARLQLRTDVAPPSPPPGPPPAWMAQRPAAVRALIDTLQTYDLDKGALRAFSQPAYFALGGLSNPDEFAEEAERLARVLPDLSLEVFPERHHFDPPHQAEPERVCCSLRSL